MEIVRYLMARDGDDDDDDDERKKNEEEEEEEEGEVGIIGGDDEDGGMMMGRGGSTKTTWPGRGRRRAPPPPPTVTPPSSTMLPLEVLSSVLFRPGMKFAGRIFIPGAAPPPAAAGPSSDQAGGGRGGDDGPDNNAYELTILMGGEDPLGNGYTLACHRAYGDEQVGFAPLLRFYISGGTSKHASLTCFSPPPPFWLTLGSSHSSENRGCRRAEARRMRR